MATIGYTDEFLQEFGEGAERYETDMSQLIEAYNETLDALIDMINQIDSASRTETQNEILQVANDLKTRGCSVSDGNLAIAQIKSAIRRIVPSQDYITALAYLTDLQLPKE